MGKTTRIAAQGLLAALCGCGEYRADSADSPPTGGGASAGGAEDGDAAASEGPADPSSGSTSQGPGRNPDEDEDDAGGGSESGEFEPLYDVGSPEGDPPDCTPTGSIEFSYIWVANSEAGTVSKIDTDTGVEVARYFSGPVGRRDPSRTSVNLDGDVAVVNRRGSITKIAAREDDCVDLDGNGVIDTSQSPNDVRFWGADECVLWNTLLPMASRPAAWTAGEVEGEDACGNTVHGPPQVWTAAPQTATASMVYLLDGETGTVEGEVLAEGANHSGLGIYGAAVDAAGDFWGITYAVGPLVHVHQADLAVETIPLPDPAAYGFTVDAQGRPWVGGWDGALQRFDPATHTWLTVPVPEAYRGLNRGMTEDAAGNLWVATLNIGGGAPGLLRVDAQRGAFIEFLGADVLDGVSTPTGTSVDSNGNVWLVDQTKGGGGAFRYTPGGGAVLWVGGLEAPYTYSDMTGWALANASTLPQG